MPAEQSLTSTRRQAGPSSGPEDGASRRSSRARLEQTAALLAPIALIGGLALAGGGFDVSGRHIAGLAVWLVVVALLVFGAGSAVRPERPLYWAGGLIVCLSLLSAISSLWSGSVELSVIEADRVAVYLGFFIAAFLIAQTDERRQRFAEGLAIAAALVAVLGLGSRLLPHVFRSSAPSTAASRDFSTRSATGMRTGRYLASESLCCSGPAGGLPQRRCDGFPLPRSRSSLLALYFTYSRGGLLSLLVEPGCLIALSRDRLWLRRPWRSGRLARCRRCSRCRLVATLRTTSRTRRMSTRAPPCC